MQVSMVELNKNANSIINRAYSSGETITVLKHGKPIAHISPIIDQTPVDDALNYLAALTPVEVTESVDSVLDQGRQRGL